MIQDKITLQRKILLSLFISTFSLLSGAFAQKWNKMVNLDPPVSHGIPVASATGFTIDFKPHVAGGKNAAVTGNVTTYLWGLEDWMLGTGITPRQEATGFSINNKGYIVGGIDENGNYKDDVWELDPNGSGWVQKNNFPGGPRANAVVFVIGNKAYVGTGSDGNALFNDFYEYTPGADSWTPIASLPGNARKDAIAFTADTNGYVGTGSTASNTVLNDIWQYNPVTNQWTAKGNFPGGARTSAVGLGLRKKGYLGTGTNGTSSYKDFWEYTPSTDSWQKLADYPGEARNEAVGYVSGARLCISFGKNASGTILNDSYYYKHTYTYDYSFSPAKICLGEEVVLKNLTDDPDAYYYDLPNNRRVKFMDTVHYTPTESGNGVGLQINIKDKSTLQTLGARRHEIGVSQIDSIVLTTLPDTCTGGVGSAIARVYQPDIFAPFGPFSYKWSTGITHAKDTSLDTLKNLSPGTFSVTVTDGGGCKASKSGAIITTYQDVPKASFTVVPDTCLSQAGQLKALPLTAKLPYSYEWSNSKTTAVITNLLSGKYSVKLKDKNGCTALDSAMVPLHTNSIKTGFTSVKPNCQTANGTITALPSGGSAPYTYLWSTGYTKNPMENIPAGWYKVQVKDKYTCAGTDSLLLEEKNTAEVPVICMVTVDSLSKHNVIVWEKSNYANVDSFIVYREISTNTYKRIGAVPYQSLSTFTDTVQHLYFPNTGDPNTGTYRYKLQILDNCGHYSALSPYHNTIFIINNNGTFSWPQLYTIEGGANPVNNYALLRDDNSTGNWKVIGTVSGSQQTITDAAYNTYKNTASYRVSTVWGISCSPSLLPTDAELNASGRSLSNIHGKGIVTGMDAGNNTLSVEFYPNPFTDKADLVISGLDPAGKAQLKWYDHLGKEVRTQIVENGKNQVERDKLANGIYFLQILDKGNVLAKAKVIIQN